MVLNSLFNDFKKGVIVGSANLVFTYLRKVPKKRYQNFLHEFCQVNNYFRIYGVIMHIYVFGHGSLNLSEIFSKMAPNIARRINLLLDGPNYCSAGLHLLLDACTPCQDKG